MGAADVNDEFETLKEDFQQAQLTRHSNSTAPSTRKGINNPDQRVIESVAKRSRETDEPVDLPRTKRARTRGGQKDAAPEIDEEAKEPAEPQVFDLDKATLDRISTNRAELESFVRQVERRIQNLPRTNEDVTEPRRLRGLKHLAQFMLNPIHDENEEDLVDVDNKVDIEKQIVKAKQQLQSAIHGLHKRLWKAKRQVDAFRATFQATPTDSMDDNQETTMNDDLIAQLQADIDVAISTTTIHQQAAAPDETNQNKLATDIQTATDLDLSFPEIQTAVNDSRSLAVISDSLARNRVEPFFHTLFLPEVFLGKRRTHATVAAGEVEERQTLNLDPFAENWDQVIDNSGYGVVSIFDNVLGATWNFCPKHTAFAVELVNTASIILGEGIECTNFTSNPLQITAGADTIDSLMTRPESRGVVAGTFYRMADAKKGSATAITGSPGIGKSWTLIYMLQQALLYEGATVLFFFQKSEEALLYLRRNNKIYAWLSPRDGIAKSVFFKRSDVLILLDPKEAVKGGANFALVKQMKLVYAASNNENHFTGGVEKEFGKIQFVLGPPLDRKLYVILKQLLGPGEQLEADVIKERMAEVGNLIRYIADNEKFELRKVATEKAVRECAMDEFIFRKVVNSDSMSDKTTTVSGTLFEVLPRRPTPLNEIGYDGQNVGYGKKIVRVISEKVRGAFLRTNRRAILSYWEKVDDNELSKMGVGVEQLFIQDLTRSECVVMTPYKQTKGRG